MRKNKTEIIEKNKKNDPVIFSLIVFLLDKLSDAVYHALCNGLFGKMFTAYSKEQTAFHNGFIKRYFTSGIKMQFYFRMLRQYFSRAFETSFFINFMNRFSQGWLAMPLKYVGKFFFSFGSYTVLIFLIRWLVPGLTQSDPGVAITGVVICVVSLPMLLSKDHIAGGIGKSVIARLLFVDAFGYREESFRIPMKAARWKNNLMILAGMLLGILTLFGNPLSILLILASALGLALIVSAPEIGVILALALCPFFSVFRSPAIFLGLLVMITVISYFIKLIRGKRILKLELMDLSVLLFMVLLFFSGVITAGGTLGYHEALISTFLVFGYFLVVNLMRTEKWLRRCALSLVGSGTVVALIGILQYAFGLTQAEASWLDADYFSDISGRATSVFENPNVLSVYLILILPFSLLFFVRATGRKNKAVCAFSVFSILLCIVLTWSRGAWLAAIVCVLLFALIYSKKTLRNLFLSCFLIPFLPMVLPQTVIKRFVSIGNLADSSILYRVYTWKGSLRMVKDYFVGGIGYGPTAFQEIYPQYAYAGIEAAEHSHNLFLQILLGMGIIGLISFLIVILLFTQMNFEYFKQSKDQNGKLMVAAALCAVTGALLMGMFDFIWYNYRVFFLFWSILALACACIRVGLDDQRRHSFSGSVKKDAATLDIQM